jgi:dihydroxy-acid dehydratase
LIEDGDLVDIDVATRRIELLVSCDVLDERRQRQLGRGGFRPMSRTRKVFNALRAYAAMATSADRGAVRDVAVLESTAREAVPSGLERVPPTLA